jgi:NAD(P)-dependent dehydrogenase (short-subunit alcohol dehydrogenase family)
MADGRDGLRTGGMVAGAWTALIVGAGLLLRRSRRMDLAGRTVVITGGSRGLGLLLARRFADKGARLVILARNQGELGRARIELEARGAEVLALPCDVGDEAAVGEAISRAVHRFGRIDVLVNNAGMIQVGPLETMSLEDFRTEFAATFWGMVHASLAVLPGMRNRGEGRIVNVTSIGGKVAVPHLLPYSAAKFAAVGFSEGLHAEAAKDGVRVVTVVPGLMRTGSFGRALFKGQREREVEWFSLGASLPILSMDAERAARRIVRATEYGEAFVTLGLPAKAARLVHGLFPGLAAEAAGMVARFLPGSGGVGPEQPAEEGREHRAGVARSFLTVLGDRAARENREWPTPG